MIFIKFNYKLIKVSMGQIKRLIIVKKVFTKNFILYCMNQPLGRVHFDAKS